MQFALALVLSLLPAVSLPETTGTATPTYQHDEVVKIALEGRIDENAVKPLVEAIDDANAAKASRIVLEINSPGGVIEPGLMLAKRIERSAVPITCIVDGEAASMASFILESCPTRIMTKRSIIMIHEPSLDGEWHGHPIEWQNMADDLKMTARFMAEHYCQRMKIRVSDLLQKIDGGRNWYMPWNEALRFKAVDIVVNFYNDIFRKK